MTDQLPKQAAGTPPAQVVEKWLYALRDEHYDAWAAALDDVVDHNVGLPTIRRRHRTVKFLRRGPSRPNAGVDVKIHSTPSKAPRC